MNYEVIRNRAKFCMFLAPEIFLGCAPKILDRHYKTRPRTDHRAKFQASWPTHLGDLTGGKKTSGLKLKSAPRAITSGWTNKCQQNISKFRKLLGGLIMYIQNIHNKQKTERTLLSSNVHHHLCTVITQPRRLAVEQLLQMHWKTQSNDVKQCKIAIGTDKTRNLGQSPT